MTIYIGVPTLIWALFFNNSGQIIAGDVHDYMWVRFFRDIVIQCTAAPFAIFYAQKTGLLTIKGLVTITLLVSILVHIMVFRVLDQLAAPFDGTPLLSMDGVLSYDFWPYTFAQLIGYSFVPVIALVVVNHLTRRLGWTRKRAA